MSASPFPLPVSLEEIDAGWLTRALRTRWPGVTVGDRAIIDVIRGTCTKIRLRLDLNEAGRQAGIPETLILKGGFEPHSRQFTFVARLEALGYRDLLTDAGLNTPVCYFADYDEERGQGLVLMEDLTRRGVVFGNALRPYSPDIVARSLSLLATFHARTWGCPAFREGDHLGWVETAPPFSRPVLQPYLEPETWASYCALPRGTAVSRRFHDRAWAVDGLKRMERMAVQVPNCVIHGDTHMGNTFVEPDGSAGFYDIVPRRAPPLSEVCYHVTLAMDLADRGRWERDLVQHYLDELKRHGVAAPGLDDAMHQYGVFLIEGFCLALTNDAYFMPEPPITANAARFGHAMLENDTIGRLARIG